MRLKGKEYLSWRANKKGLEYLPSLKKNTAPTVQICIYFLNYQTTENEKPQIVSQFKKDELTKIKEFYFNHAFMWTIISCM